MTRETPAAIAVEREQIEAVLQKTVTALQIAHKNAMDYQQQLEARLTKLPQEIAVGISPEAIAAKITEGIRQRWTETGLPVTADAIGTHASSLNSASREVLSTYDGDRRSQLIRCRESQPTMMGLRIRRGQTPRSLRSRPGSAYYEVGDKQRRGAGVDEGGSVKR